MRREALARWLNLSVIAAIIAVLTVVLVNAPTRNIAIAADVCGQDGSPTVDPDMTIEWDAGRPSSGSPGTWTGIEVSWEAAPSDFELIAVWRPDESDFAEEVASRPISGNDGSVGIDFTVPADADAGTYAVTVCWSSDGGLTWNAVNPSEYLTFTVEEQSVCYGEQPDFRDHALTTNPSSGPYPSTFDATGSAGSVEGSWGIVAQLIWDWSYDGESVPSGTILAQMAVPEGNLGLINFDDIAVPAPPAGSLGTHNLAICGYDNSFPGGWFYVPFLEDGVTPTTFTVVDGTEEPSIEDCAASESDSFYSFTYSDEATAKSGPAGSSLVGRIVAGEGDVFGDFSLIWGFGSGEDVVLASGTGSGDILDIDFAVPEDALPGIYQIHVCHFDGEQWIPLEDFVTFTVLEDEIPDISTCSDGIPSTAHTLFYETGNQNLHAGPPGAQDAARLTALGSEPSLGDWAYSLIWDVDTDAPFVLGQLSADLEPSQVFNFTVPYDAAAGLHTIGVCYLFDNDGTWEWRPAGSTIQFNVQSPAPCGTVANIGETNQIGLTPNQGQVGSTFLATISAVEMGLEDALLVQLIWDWVPGNGDNIPPGGQVIAQISKADSTNQAAVTGMVPTAAALGPHTLNICYYVPFDLGGAGVGIAESNFGEWIAGEPNVFDVVEPEGLTPTPPTSTPIPTATPVTPTATTEPDNNDEDLGPEPTVTPTVPIVPIFGPTVTPTVIGNVARTGPEMTQTALASLPQTPGPGTTNGGGGGTGGGGGPGGGGGGTGGGGTTLNPNTGTQETTTPGTSTPAASATQAPTATRGPATPTPTPFPDQTESPSSDVQGARTEWVQSVKSAQDITSDFDVILTNVLLTGLLLLLIFLTSEIFNQTIRDNQDDVESWMRNFFGPVIGIWGGLSAMMGTATLGNQKLKDLAWLGIVLLITVLIEGFLDPGFGFNKASVLLFLSLLVAVGLVTYLTEGGEAFVARSFFGQQTAVRVFPAAIGIALVCVIMSRLGGFIPGILYGFVGTAVFLRPSTLNADQTGKMIFLPMAMMLAISIGAWMLVDQFRGPDASDFDVFVEGVLIGIFVATIEGVAINMLPIAYMDGRKLIDWNPIMWIATAGVALFLLWTVLINDERAYFDSLQETTSQIAIIAVVFCFGLSIMTWLWFRYRPGGHA